MKKILQFIIEFLIALLLTILLIKAQKNQRRCNIDPVELKPGKKTAVYYQYEEYQKTKTLKNN